MNSLKLLFKSAGMTGWSKMNKDHYPINSKCDGSRVSPTGWSARRVYGASLKQIKQEG